MTTNYILSIIRSGLGVMTSRVFGLIRDVTVAGVYGATGLTDIFFMAFAIPNLFRQFFAEGAIASAYVPFLSDKTSRRGNIAANAYLTQLIVIQTLMALAVCVMLIVFAPFVIMLFMPGRAHNATDIALGAILLRLLTPYLFFVSISGLLAGFLNLRGSYFIAYASTSCLNVMMIIGAVIGHFRGGNIYALALSVFVGGMFQFIMVFTYSWHKQFRFGALTPRDPDIKNTYKLLVPSLAGVGISQLNFLIGRALASALQAGSISWLYYSNRIFQLPLGIFSVTISTVSLTELSKARTNGDIHQVNKLIDKAIIGLIFIMLPATIGIIGLSQEIIQLIYGRLAFKTTDIINTASALQMYSAGLIFYSFASVFTRIYHSEKNTKTPVKYAVVAFLVNAALCALLMKHIGHAGIALASSVAALVNTVMLYSGIRGYQFNFRAHIPLLLKILIAAYTMTAVMIICKMVGIPVLVNITACIAVYFMVLRLSKVNIMGI
ncbi:MAG: murein biosynthesis integral membrane protein MurJ, partial [Deferribacteraceae bacterium]|nr:murein biosynthesis integral membrane protein MurJ [Deferribacteraceae bacterium]